jgi:hypothetical protein
MEALLKRCRIHPTVALRVAGRGPRKNFQQYFFISAEHSFNYI